MQELMLCVTALAQLGYYDTYLMATASQAFVSAVGAAGSSASAAPAASSVSCNNTQQQLQQPVSLSSKKCQQGTDADVLPNIRDLQLVINYLWANASLGYSSPLLLQAALQLLLITGGHVQRIGKSHLPLCMWALSALLVCMLHAAAQDVTQEPADLQQAAAAVAQPHRQNLQQQQQQQQQQQLMAVVHGVHHVLAAQAYAWWLQPASKQSSALAHGSGAPQGVGSSASKQQQRSRQSRGSSGSVGSSRGRDVPAFSIDSRRQMYQAHIWLQAASAAAASATSTMAAAAAGASGSGVTTSTAASTNHGSTQLERTTGAAAAAAVAAVAQAEAVGSTPGVGAATATGEAAAAHREASLWELQELIAVLQQQQQQQLLQQQLLLLQQEQPDVMQVSEHQGRQGDRVMQMATFWDFCEASWSSNTPKVSLLQQQVFEVRPA